MCATILRGFLFAPLLWLASPALAQAPAAAQEPEVLLPPDAPMGGWGGPTVEFGEVNGQAGLFVGGRGGWLIARRFTIGGAGMGLVTPVDGPRAVLAPRDLKVAYGGLWLETTFQPLELLHVTAGLIAGGGGADLTPDGEDYAVKSDGFFVVEPSVCLELNVGRTVRADLGATYRLVGGFALEGLDGKDLSGPALILVVKFGSF
ncbi:MAG: hypothetical protein U0229_13605 [Anaeromyxobacter sp.]